MSSAQPVPRPWCSTGLCWAPPGSVGTAVPVSLQQSLFPHAPEAEPGMRVNGCAGVSLIEWQRAEHWLCWVSSARPPAHRSSRVQGESPGSSIPAQTRCQQPWMGFPRTSLPCQGMQPQQERSCRQAWRVAQQLKNPWGKGVVNCPGQGNRLFPLRSAPPPGEHSQGEFLLKCTVREKTPNLLPSLSTDQLPAQVRAVSITQQLLP